MSGLFVGARWRRAQPVPCAISVTNAPTIIDLIESTRVRFGSFAGLPSIGTRYVDVFGSGSSGH